MLQRTIESGENMDTLTSIEQIEVQFDHSADFIDLEKVKDINRIFSELNRLKAQLADLSVLKGLYAAAVNELYEVSINDSEGGEQISNKALELGIAIQAAEDTYKEIKKLELELAEKYGFLYAKSHAA